MLTLPVCAVRKLIRLAFAFECLVSHDFVGIQLGIFHTIDAFQAFFELLQEHPTHCTRRDRHTIRPVLLAVALGVLLGRVIPLRLCAIFAVLLFRCFDQVDETVEDISGDAIRFLLEIPHAHGTCPEQKPWVFS